MYQAFTIHMEPRSLAELSATIQERLRGPGVPVDETAHAELLNLANEIDARLQKLPLGLEQNYDFLA